VLVLLTVAFFLLLLAVVGHVLWLFLAAVVRTLVGGLPPEQATPSRERPVDPKLRDLEITTRTIRALLASGELDQASADRVEQCLQARRRALQPQPVAPITKPPRPTSASLIAELEELLDGAAHPRDLPAHRRQAALVCYRLLNNSQRAALKAPTLLAVARLLSLAGLTSRALDSYRRLLDDHPNLPDRGTITLEAARFAVHEKQLDLARRFLRVALAGVLSAQEYEEVQAMLRRLDESVQAPAAVVAESLRDSERTRGASAPQVVAEPQEVPEVIPVSPLGAAAVRPAPVVPAPSLPAIVPAPPRPRRSLTNVLAAFMEERNILWGELAGGLLIVGCSIALVITLWHSLEELPYFPFLLFACITAALFGAGEYTLHHWKLESTSRGLLVIALLLVPLNLLVLADPSLGHSGTMLEWTFKSAAILLALGMVRLAGRDLIGADTLPGPVDRRWLFALALVGAAGSQLIVPRLLDEQHPILYVALGCVPVACHLLACGAVVAGLSRALSRAENQRLQIRQANALFVFLGLASFALFVALGFLLSRSGDLSLALPRLATPFTLVGVPILAGGLLVRRGLPREEGGGPRTAGTAVAFTGLALMLSAVVLAWPQPLALLLVCLANAAILSALAFRWRLPHAHVVALPCLALAVLIVVQLALGNLTIAPEVAAGWWLAEQLLSPSGGVALAILAALLTAGAEVLARAGHRVHAVSYALGGGAMGACALLTTACHGIEAPWAAALVHGLVALGALAMHARWRRPALSYTGLGLLVAASLWTLWATVPDDLAAWGFVLALESSVLAVAAVRPHPLRGACRDVAAVAAVLAMGLALLTPGFPAGGLHTGTAAVLALTAFLLAHVFRRSELTWVASAFLFAALAHLLIWDFDTLAVPRPLLLALLAHATLALLGSLLLRAWRTGDGKILHLPLSDSAQLTSLLAVPLLFVPGVAALILSGYTLWLAGLWLLVAVLRRLPDWFTAFQAALSMAVVFAVDAWLPDREWYDPRSLQAYGIGLGVLGLGWIAARMAFSSHPRVRQLWEAPWPSLDRVVLAALVVGQFALALWGVSPGVAAELTPAGYVSTVIWPSTTAYAYGAGAWILLGVLAFVLLTALREKGRTSVLLGLLLLAVTAAILAAGPFASEVAAASALRWGLSLFYLVCSVLVWLRRPLARWAASVGVTHTEGSLAVLSTHILLGVVAASMMLLTAQVALLVFAGLRPTGPAAGSIFAEMGWIVSNVTPLVLLTTALAGHAARERSPGYAFAAGLVANLCATGGYALAMVTSGRHLNTEEIVCILEIASLTAALWALAWMWSLPWLSAVGIRLMTLEIGLALAGQLVLLGSAIFVLGDLSGGWIRWPVAAGGMLGWSSLLASLAAPAVWHGQQRRPLPWGWPFLGGLAATGLLACTIERTWPGAGFHALLLGWPVYVLLWAFLSVTIEGRYQRSAPAMGKAWLSFVGFKNTAPIMLLPCIASIFWALNVAVVRQEYLWAAATISLCCAAAALLAAWQRNEKLAFLAGLGVNLAASLLVWRLYYPSLPSWLSVVQANAIASAGVTLLWLGVRRRLMDRRPGSFLAMQAMLGLAIHTALLILPLFRINADPGTPLGPSFAEIGSVVGWAALLLSSAAAYCHLAVSSPHGRIHVLGIAGLSAGVLAACMAGPWDNGQWRSFHVLLMIWCALGLAATIAGEFAAPFRPRELRRWLEGIGMAILAMVLHNCWRDPLRPIIPALAVFVVSVMAGMLALWSRRQHYVWISGLLLNLIGLLFWSAWGSFTVTGLLLMNALGLAAAAAIWTVLDLAQPASSRIEESFSVARFTRLTFAPFAVNLALALAVVVVVLLLATDLQTPRATVSEPLAWPALATVGVALLAALWDRRAGFAPPGLYVLGLAAVGLMLHQWTRTPAGLGWSAAVALAGYAVVASSLYHIFRRSREHWFLPAQACVASVVIALSLWMCLDFAALVERLGGPIAVLLLVPAAVVLIGRAGGVSPLFFPQQGADAPRSPLLRPAALAFGALAAAEIAWACPDPAGLVPWLHRNVLLMAALAVMTAFYGVALPRWLGRDAEWVRVARRFGPLLGVLASLTLLVLLVQEFRLYNPATRRTPMAWPEVLVVAVALVTLMVSGIRFAVVPGRDPFGLSERGRTLYVYAVELLLVLLFLHVRLNVPVLFRGWAAKYWTILVMLIAFIGVGLSEFFERRRLRVLAEPLQRTGVFLPLLPLFAFWAKPPAPLLTFADSHAPGLRPLLGYLDKLPQHFDSYSFLWLLVCGLYGLVSLTRRSFVFALLAALAANFALWSLLAHHGIAFLLHPQCWLIPPALIVLAAEYTNRDRLRPELGAGLRYLGISMIYVSSTADLFIAGLGNSVVLPIVLAVLSLAGMLLGILFRVRAFLFLGISFLFLDVFTMIWYAAVDRYQTWIWWVSGIVLGAAILTLFAVFEKRRDDMLRLLEEIKHWD
jgi:hypothetical protein